MKTCDEMVNRLLERRALYVSAQKKKKKVLVSTIASFCVVAVVGIAVWKMPSVTEQPPVAPDDQQNSTTQTTPITKPTYNILWKEAEEDMSTGEIAVDTQMGKTIEWGLKKTLENLPQNTKVAVAAYPYMTDPNFVWNGKSLKEYSDAFDAERSMLNKLGSLAKMGNMLKYGEALLTGTPDGEKWSKELYEETIAYYGEELLSKYIVNGEFLKDQLEADIEIMSGEGSAYYAYESACAAYNAYALDEAEKQLAAHSIDYDASNSADSGCIIMFVDAEQFSAFTMESIENWCFCLARNGENNRWMDDVVGDFDGGNI